jgi:ketosteroid isomerase-like protein
MDHTARQRVEAEIRTAFEGYEQALQTNDVAALSAYFWEDPRAVRIGPEGGLYGHAQIAAFRKARDVSDIARELFETRILALSDDCGVATTEYRRVKSGRHGAQTQTWIRTSQGWRIAMAHVSLQP